MKQQQQQPTVIIKISDKLAITTTTVAAMQASELKWMVIDSYAEPRPNGRTNAPSVRPTAQSDV